MFGDLGLIMISQRRVGTLLKHQSFRAYMHKIAQWLPSSSSETLSMVQKKPRTLVAKGDSEEASCITTHHFRVDFYLRQNRAASER